MKQFEIKFKFFGKYMKTKIHAQSKQHAIELLQSKIEIIETKEIDQSIEELRRIFNMT